MNPDNNNREKSPNALRTIGEVAERLKVKQHVLRFWEKKFTQIKPVVIRKRRYYRPEDIEIINFIKELLYDRGFTIKGAVKHISEHGLKYDALAHKNIDAGSNISNRESTSISSDIKKIPSITRLDTEKIIEKLRYAKSRLAESLIES